MITAPLNSSKYSSNTSNVSISKSFVGSSNISILGEVKSTLNKYNLLFSPPLKLDIYEYWLSLKNKNLSNIWVIDNGPSTVCITSPISFKKSYTLLFKGKFSFSCEKYPTFTVSPISILPVVGYIKPVISFNSVVLPIPFLPIIPTLASLSSKYEKSFTITLSL